MKIATHMNNTGHFPQASHAASKVSKSSRGHYAIVVLLVLVAYLLSSWVAAAPGTTSAQTGSGLALFWLGGGLITLILLTFAAKR